MRGLVTIRVGSAKKESWREAVCPSCGTRRTVSFSYWRRLNLGQYTGLCRPCRLRGKRPVPSAADYRFWTSRFSMEEISVMGQAIWGGDGYGALTASAERPESAIE